jgi:hypothetical protein
MIIINRLPHKGIESRHCSSRRYRGERIAMPPPAASRDMPLCQKYGDCRRQPAQAPSCIRRLQGNDIKRNATANLRLRSSGAVVTYDLRGVTTDCRRRCYFLKSGSLPESVVGLRGVAAPGSLPCVRAGAGCDFAPSERSCVIGCDNSVMVYPAGLASDGLSRGKVPRKCSR